MKKIMSTLLIAAIGGASAMLVQKQFSSNNEHSQLLDHKVNTPVSFAGNYGSAAGTGVDFTVAAETTINSVVQIKKTKPQTTNNLA